MEAQRTKRLPAVFVTEDTSDLLLTRLLCLLIAIAGLCWGMQVPKL